MKTQFRRAVKPRELRSLEIFDRKAFHNYPADWFDRETWQALDAWWMIVDNRKIGCCAFDAQSAASLYIASTGILPGFQGRGFGDLLKSWQIAYARHRGFKRIVTHTRASNKPMITLNKKFGFKVVRTTPDYYENPSEPAIVMALRL